MKRIKIINENYYNVLIGILGSLILYNLYALVSTPNLIVLLALFIQSGLIYCLITKNLISQMLIKIWVIVVFFIAQGFRIIGTAMQSLGKYLKGEEGAVEMITSSHIIYAVVYVLIGVIIWILNKEFGEINEYKDVFESQED